MDNSKIKNWENEEWYKSLPKECEHVADLIFKYHDYFRKRDKRYKKIVIFIKVCMLLLTMSNTIILGIKNLADGSWQITTGLIISAIITSLAALSSFFNFEKYWMRNISIHIGLNKLRDNFMFEAKAGKLDSMQQSRYMKKLDAIQDDNIKYWENAIKGIE